MASTKQLLKAAVVVPVALMVGMIVVLGPFIGVSDNVPANTKHLTVAVANLDGPSSSVAAALQQFLTAAAASATSPLPEYRVVTGVTNEADLTDRVNAGEWWGGIAVRPGATARLNAALYAAPNASNPAFSTYDPASAMVYVWSEGRNPAVTSRSSSPTRLLLTKFSAVLAQGLARQVAAAPGGGAKLAAIAASAPWLLTTPVAFTEVNTAVAWTMPTALLSMTVGSVLVVVLSFGAVRLVAQRLPAQEAMDAEEQSGGKLVLNDGLQGPPTPARLLLSRSAVLMLSSLSISLMYAILVVGMSKGGYRGGGEGWARMWAIQLLLSLCYTGFMAGVLELSGDKQVTTFFVPVAYYTTLSAYNLDTADEGYKVFMYNPVYHSARLLRNNFFGPGALGTSSDIGTAVGVLFAWAVFSWAFYPLVALLLKPWLIQRMQAKAKAAAGAAAGGAEVVVKGKDIAGAGSPSGSEESKGAGESPAASKGADADGEGTSSANASGDATRTGTTTSGTAPHVQLEMVTLRVPVVDAAVVVENPAVQPGRTG